MPTEHLSDADRNELDQQLAAIDFDNSLKTLETIRESAYCRTEIVSDASGILHIRKTMPHDPAILERGKALMEVKSRYLARVEKCYELDNLDIMVLEYVLGATLRTQVANAGLFYSDAALQLLSEMDQGARTLHQASPHPLVHRDINPDNIIMRAGDDGLLHACLIDYSIARMVRDDATTDTRHLGTQRYAAPEQYGFKQTDARSDIFALGLVLVFMLTGADPAFDENGMPISLEKLPEDVRIIVQRCTAFDPARRYVNDNALLADIESVRRKIGIGDNRGVSSEPAARGAAASASAPASADRQQAASIKKKTSVPSAGKLTEEEQRERSRMIQEEREAAREQRRLVQEAEKQKHQEAMAQEQWQNAKKAWQKEQQKAAAREAAVDRQFLWRRIHEKTAAGNGRALWIAWRLLITLAAIVFGVRLVHAGTTTTQENLELWEMVCMMLDSFIFVLFPAYALLTDFRNCWERCLGIHPVRNLIIIVVMALLLFSINVLVIAAVSLV